MFLKWHFVWKHVENVSEYQIDQIGWKNIKIQHFPIFPSLQKNNFQKLSNFEYIYGHKCPPIGLFWRIFFGFFRYTETVFRRYYRNSPKLHFGWITELNRNFGRTLYIRVDIAWYLFPKCWCYYDTLENSWYYWSSSVDSAGVDATTRPPLDTYTILFTFWGEEVLSANVVFKVFCRYFWVPWSSQRLKKWASASLERNR